MGTQGDPDALRNAFAEVLRRALEPAHGETQRASVRNRERSTIFARFGGQVLAPAGTLLHGTPAAALPLLLRSANVAGEASGLAVGKSDALPGYVDFHVLDGKTGVGSALDRAYHGAPAALLYFPDDLTGQVHPAGSESHVLRFGAVANTELAAIVAASDSVIEAAKTALVERELYVPIVHPEKGLVFSPSDFDALTATSKQFASLAELVDGDAVFSPAHHAQLDTDGTQSLASHMNRAVERARELASETGLGSDVVPALLAAAKLHDLGKLERGAQEDTNLAAARGALTKVAGLDRETQRRALLLIRYDELLGEILKGMEPSAEGYRFSERAVEKRALLRRVFSPAPELEHALVVLFMADIQAKGRDYFRAWDIEGKLRHLGYAI
jgi:hypothetical protein